MMALSMTMRLLMRLVHELAVILLELVATSEPNVINISNNN
jgi:hypothetical protein